MGLSQQDRAYSGPICERMTRVTLIRQRFYVDDRRDAELIAFLAQQPNKSEAIRQAVYEYMVRCQNGKEGTRPEFDWDLLGIIVRNAIQESLATTKIALIADQGAPMPADQTTFDDGIQDGVDTLLDTWDL